MSLVRAMNGRLWVCWIADSTVKAKQSSDGGKTWSATIGVKSKLKALTGITDAVAFAYSGSNYIGLGYAENTLKGSKFGFLRHKDSDNDTVWTDESAGLPTLTGVDSDDHISMLAHLNEIFLVIKTSGGGEGTVKNALYHRGTNGTWNLYPILIGNGWTRPVMAIDATNDTLHVFGIREGDPGKPVERKKVALGSYGSLVSAAIDTVFDYVANAFVDLSAPRSAVSGMTDLIMLASNSEQDNVWTQFIPIPGGAPKISMTADRDDEQSQAANEALAMRPVWASPNPFNPQTQIHFRLEQSAPVRLHIYDVNGRLVRTLADDVMQAGHHSRIWNSRDQKGQLVTSGVYFYRLQIGNDAWNGRLMLVK